MQEPKPGATSLYSFKPYSVWEITQRLLIYLQGGYEWIVFAQIMGVKQYIFTDKTTAEIFSGKQLAGRKPHCSTLEA